MAYFRIVVSLITVERQLFDGTNGNNFAGFLEWMVREKCLLLWQNLATLYLFPGCSLFTFILSGVLHGKKK
jgi:hypothetical protein